MKLRHLWKTLIVLGALSVGTGSLLAAGAYWAFESLDAAQQLLVAAAIAPPLR